jgi:hypothetical protein
MVCGWERGYVRLRLVQDFGRPENGLTPAAQPEARRAACLDAAQKSIDPCNAGFEARGRTIAAGAATGDAGECDARQAAPDAVSHEATS